MSPRTRCQPGPEAVLGAALADGLLFVAGGEMMTGFLSRLSRNRKQKAHICSAVVVAAGTASRMEGIDKILTTLGDLPVLVHTLRVFEDCPDIAEVVVVTREDLLVDFALYKQEIDLLKNTRSLEFAVPGRALNGQAHCNMGNTKYMLDLILNWNDRMLER